MPGRHWLSGLSVMVVSNMSSPAGSVAVSARPAFPHTCSTSGNHFRMPSWIRRISRARATLTPGSVVGMKRMVPSSSGGMNSLPIRVQGIQVSTSATSAPRSTAQRCAQHQPDDRPVEPISPRLSGLARSRYRCARG